MEVDVRKMLTGIVAENTIISYERAWRVYLEFAGNTEAAFNGTTLVQWRQELCAGKHSASTINSLLAGIKTIFRELYNHKLIGRELYWESRDIQKLPRTAFKERRRPNNRIRIDPEIMRKICKTPVVTGDDHIAMRDRAMLMVLATTGVRVSEMLAMRVRDVYSPSKGVYVVANVLGKNHADPRDVPLSPEAYNAIMDWVAFRPVQSPYIFSGYSYDPEREEIDYSEKPMNHNIVRRRIKYYGRQVGLPHIKAHDFRRFVGTQLAALKGIRVAQKVLGHVNIETTATNYVLDDFEPGITDNLFTLSPVVLLFYMFPSVATHNIADVWLANVIQACYSCLGHLLNFVQF